MYKTDVYVTLLIVTVAFALCIMTDALTVSSDPTPEYQQAYKLAYAEHNETKYNAALEIINVWGIGYTDEQYNYAQGYHAGYIAYNQDMQYQENLNERNNTVKTLFGE